MTISTTLSERGAARALIGSPDPATTLQRARDVVASIATGRYHALSIERGGQLAGYGMIELTTSGYHVHIVAGRYAELPHLSLRDATADTAARALAELATEPGGLG